MIPYFIPEGCINMGVLADIQAITTQSAQTATDQAAVTTAQTSLTAAQAVVAQDSQTATTEDQQLVTDLTAVGGTVFIADPKVTGNVLVYTVDPNSPVGFTIASVPPAA